MIIEDFTKCVEQEVDWLRYYARKDTRIQLTEKSELYDVLISIGYAKRRIELSQRCAACILTADIEITKDIKITELNIIYEHRNHNKNCYTPLEIYWMKYPEKRYEIINNINE